MSQLFDSRAKVLEYEAKQALIEKEIELEKLKQHRKPLTDEQIDEATRNSADELLDHIYEYGTAAEGVMERIRSVARAAIDAANRIKGDA